MHGVTCILYKLSETSKYCLITKEFHNLDLNKPGQNGCIELQGIN